MVKRADRKKVRALRRELRQDGGLNRDDRKQVRALRQHIKARSHARRAEKLDPDESWKKKRGKGEEQPEQNPEHEERTNQRPYRRNPAAMRELPGPLGPGARLRRRRPEPDEDIDDVEVITEDADTQEAVDTLTGMLGEIGGVTSFSGTAPGLGAVVAALRSRGYTPGDITGGLQDFGYELLDQVARSGAEIGATVGEAREAAGPVIRAVKALGRGVKRVAKGIGKGAKKVVERARSRRAARREGLRAEHAATAEQRAMVVNDTNVSPRSLLRDWSEFIAPPEMGMRFQVAAGKAVYVQPVDANKTIWVVTTAPNAMGAMTEAVAKAAGQSLLASAGMATWKRALDPLAIAEVKLLTAGPLELGCNGRRCLECEQGL